MDSGRRQRVERASMLFTECGRETGGILHSDPVAICLEHLAQGCAICQVRPPIPNADRPASQHLGWKMGQGRWVGGSHDRDIVIEPFHALRPNLETLKVTRIKGHIVYVEHGPAWFLGHALGIFANLAELVRRDQNELQTIDLTHQRLERECLAYTALTFEQSEGHMAPLNERGEQGPKSRHILLLKIGRATCRERE